MLPRISLAFALVLAAPPAHAQTNLATTNGDAAVQEAVEVLRGSEVWRDFGGNGHAGIGIRIGPPGIRVHEAATPPAEYVRVHGAMGEPSGADIPTHGLADEFAPSRIPVQRLNRSLGGDIRVHGLRDDLRPSGIRVHGFGSGTVFGFSRRY